MYFLFPKWREFCERLDGENIHSVTAKDVLSGLIKEKYLILKHDIETNVERAYKMAQIENIYGHKGSYYVQAYLLDNKENISLLQKNQFHLLVFLDIFSSFRYHRIKRCHRCKQIHR